MIVSQSQVIAQHYQGSTTSTSPELPVMAPVAKPLSLLQIGTSALTQGALLLALWVYDAVPASQKAFQAIHEGGVVAYEPPPAITARSSEMVETIITMFGLNRSQAADVMQVRRQSVYNWLGGAEAEGDNLDRMLFLYQIARSLSAPIEPHLAVRSTPEGTNSLLRMLSADRLDREEIVAWIATLVRPGDIPWPQPLDEILREAGIERNAERESRRAADGIRYLQG